MSFTNLYLRTIFVVVATLLCCLTSRADLKPRLVVLTDICPSDVEPDDMESAIHLLAYADCFEIEAICTTVGWNCDPYPAEWQIYLAEVVDAYAKDVDNLKVRSNQKDFLPLTKEEGKQEIGYWPSADYIRSRTMPGSWNGGIRAIGPNNDSQGSDYLIRLADEKDDRPIYVAAWGGANTLAQAIWKVQQTRSAKELKRFLQKFRLYTISDQDMQYSMRMNRAYSSHMWMRREFAEDLLFVWDEGTWQHQCELGKENWEHIQHNVQGKGHLGKIYPNYKWGVEGDTPSFLNVMPNGLSNPDDPTQANWAGVHQWGICPDSTTTTWTSWQEPLRKISVNYKNYFYTDELSDFCARMQWADEGKGNRNPIVNVNGNSSLKPLEIKVKVGKTIVLDASGSYDPDEEELTYKWWIQPEATTYNKPLAINGKDSYKASIEMPSDACGSTIHIISEVHDKGPFHLVAYKRIIIHVK